MEALRNERLAVAQPGRAPERCSAHGDTLVSSVMSLSKLRASSQTSWPWHGVRVLPALGRQPPFSTEQPRARWRRSHRSGCTPPRAQLRTPRRRSHRSGCCPSVFHFLDEPADVLFASAACRRWRELACADSVWRARFERENLVEKARLFEVALPASPSRGSLLHCRARRPGSGWLSMRGSSFSRWWRLGRLLPVLSSRPPSRVCPPLSHVRHCINCPGVPDA